MSESELALVYLDRFGVFASSSGKQGRAKTPIHCFELPLLCHKCVEQNALNCLGIDMNELERSQGRVQLTCSFVCSVFTKCSKVFRSSTS